MSILHPDLLAHADRYAEGFETNEPFRHVQIPNFFADDVVERMLEQFPIPKPEEMLNEFGNRSQKYACHDVRSIGPVYREIDDFIRTDDFSRFMGKLTGIDDLLYDPEYHGAGTHDNMSGQGMDPHVDFNLHRTTGYHRRINAIIYLNEDWQEEWGGCLQVHKNPWDPENDWTKTYLPTKNNCVLFETNEISWHGFEPVRHPTNSNISRKSFTIYMYTKDRPVAETASKHGTIYVPRPLPDHMVPGYTLTEDDVADLRQNFAKRNSMIEGMYRREAKMNDALDAMRAFKANFQVPIDGFARQQGPAEGFHGNLGLTRTAGFDMRFTRPATRLELKLFVPDYIEGQSFELVVDDVSLAVEETVEGKPNGHLRTLSAPFEAANGQVASVLIRANVDAVPADLDVSADKRPYAGFFRALRVL